MVGAKNAESWLEKPPFLGGDGDSALLTAWSERLLSATSLAELSAVWLAELSAADSGGALEVAESWRWLSSAPLLEVCGNRSPSSKTWMSEPNAVDSSWTWVLELRADDPEWARCFELGKPETWAGELAYWSCCMSNSKEDLSVLPDGELAWAALNSVSFSATWSSAARSAVEFPGSEVLSAMVLRDVVESCFDEFMVGMTIPWSCVGSLCWTALAIASAVLGSRGPSPWVEELTEFGRWGRLGWEDEKAELGRFDGAECGCWHGEEEEELETSGGVVSGRVCKAGTVCAVNFSGWTMLLATPP